MGLPLGCRCSSFRALLLRAQRSLGGFRLSPATQRAWRWSGWINLREEFDNFNTERQSQPFENGDGRVLPVALKPTDIGPVDIGIDGKVLLRQSPFDA